MNPQLQDARARLAQKLAFLNWFRSDNKPGGDSEPTPPPPPTPKKRYPDDWQLRHEHWQERTICHCGQYQWCSGGSCFTGYAYSVCPTCGHSDKWETFVSRRAYEFSKSRPAGEDTRNMRLERWTEESCTVKETP